MKTEIPEGNDRAVDDGPVTRRELEQLRALRERPAPKLEYNTPLQSTDAGLRAVKALREARAKHVEGRLRRIERQAENEFTRAGLKSRAKRGFERSR